VLFLLCFLEFLKIQKFVRMTSKKTRKFTEMFRRHKIVRYAVRVTRTETRLTVYWALQLRVESEELRVES
jgi:hypothetical protein